MNDKEKFYVEMIDKSGAGRRFGSGKSEEYDLGTQIYNELVIGGSHFFSSEINSKALLTRLSRLNKYNGTEYEYTTKKDAINGNFDLAIECNSVIEGFRIYRVK